MAGLVGRGLPHRAVRAWEELPNAWSSLLAPGTIHDFVNSIISISIIGPSPIVPGSRGEEARDAAVEIKSSNYQQQQNNLEVIDSRTKKQTKTKAPTQSDNPPMIHQNMCTRVDE